MHLKEIFDTDFKLDFHSQGRMELAAFKSDEDIYVIQIEKLPLLEFPELKGKKTAEVSFYIHKDGEENSDINFSTNKVKSFSGDVYGIVGNNLKREFARYDAFYFSAQKRHSSNEKEFRRKMKIYGAVANKMGKEIGDAAKFYEVEKADKGEFLISKIKLSAETQKKTGFTNQIDEATKSFFEQLDWANIPAKVTTVTTRKE